MDRERKREMETERGHNMFGPPLPDFMQPSIKVVKAMPPVKNPNFWKIEGKERKERGKRREREWKGFQWRESNIEGLQKGLQTHLGFLT